MIFVLSAFSALAFECVKPVTADELNKTIEAAETAFIELDEDGFRDKVNDAAGLLLPCVSEALDDATVARHHRLMALHLMAMGDESGAFAAADAAKAADPEYVWPDDLLNAEHPLRIHYEAAEPSKKTRRVPEPRQGSIAFDGEHTRNRPAFQPTVAQIFDAQGLALSTTYLASREPLPPYRAIPRRRNTLIVASGSALVIAGSLYGMAFAQRSNLFTSAKDQSVAADDLNAKRDRTNALTLASGAFLGISIGTGVAAALIGEQ